VIESSKLKIDKMTGILRETGGIRIFFKRNFSQGSSAGQLFIGQPGRGKVVENKAGMRDG